MTQFDDLQTPFPSCVGGPADCICGTRHKRLTWDESCVVLRTPGVCGDKYVAALAKMLEFADNNPRFEVFPPKDEKTRLELFASLIFGERPMAVALRDGMTQLVIMYVLSCLLWVHKTEYAVSWFESMRLDPDAGEAPGTRYWELRLAGRDVDHPAAMRMLREETERERDRMTISELVDKSQQEAKWNRERLVQRRGARELERLRRAGANIGNVVYVILCNGRLCASPLGNETEAERATWIDPAVLLPAMWGSGTVGDMENVVDDDDNDKDLIDALNREWDTVWRRAWQKRAGMILPC